MHNPKTIFLQLNLYIIKLEDHILYINAETLAYLLGEFRIWLDLINESFHEDVGFMSLGAEYLL